MFLRNSQPLEMHFDLPTLPPWNSDNVDRCFKILHFLAKLAHFPDFNKLTPRLTPKQISYLKEVPTTDFVIIKDSIMKFLGILRPICFSDHYIKNGKSDAI